MTIPNAVSEKEFSCSGKIRTVRLIECISAVLLTLAAALIFSDEISSAVRDGLGLATNVIIPSVFPFIILSDLLYSMPQLSSSLRARRIFESVFGINGDGIYPFILGALCGFPMGVKAAAELYRDGRISRGEAERLIGFTNNTGPAFIVCGIGSGMRGSLTDGIMLYAAMLISAIAVGILSGMLSDRDKSISPVRKDSHMPVFRLSESIKNAGYASLNICSFIIFFSALEGLLSKLTGDSGAYLLLLPLFEIGGAASAISKSRLLSRKLSFILTGFAIGFSGASVHMQAKSFLIGTGISMKKYYPMKFIQGMISAGVCAVFYLFV